MAAVLLSAVFFVCSCDMQTDHTYTDTLNDMAYRYHYISLDSTQVYAEKALASSGDYDCGRVEAMNNLAFVDIIRMDYPKAEDRLKEILRSTDNQFELLVANVQMMRLCQRESRNKEFYDYYWQANSKIQRIGEERDRLTPRQLFRLSYAKTELSITLAAYLYYVGQIEASSEALSQIEEKGDIQKDTAQLMNYYYNAGSGGLFINGTPEETARREFMCLVKCYSLALTTGSIFWEAEALQAMSEHLQDDSMREVLMEDNVAVMRYLNPEDIPGHLLAGNMAQQSLELFDTYGDTYQTAGALRTLSDCYFKQGDYGASIACLSEALGMGARILQSPSLASSLYEKLSINYAAVDDKQRSDYYRNSYMDLHEDTRQDRELEARAEMLGNTSLEQKLMIVVVCSVILLVIVLLFVFTRMRRRDVGKYSVDKLLQPLDRWKEREQKVTEETAERYEEIMEEQETAELLLERNLQKNIEQRAKMALVNSITPFIDRMLAEIHWLLERKEPEEVMNARYEYILELTDKINEYNGVLTDWIQLRRGELNLKIESFRLQELFDMAKKSRLSFSMKGVELVVEDTEAVVKADRTLTLFMLNTIADNARKATDKGGKVVVSAVDATEYVEIRVEDTGKGMSEEELRNVFNHQPSADSHTKQPQHGFGLMNCKGIIEKYKKVSQVFSVCSVAATSEPGKGTAFCFRLPHGVVRMAVMLLGLFCSLGMSAAKSPDKIQMFTDSVYFCNLQGRYRSALTYADSACSYLNIQYNKLRPYGKAHMVVEGTSPDNAAELQWLSDSLAMNYSAIIDLRNETAVAALALHRWEVYNYNNKVYSRLFREWSADPSLPAYVKRMKQSNETRYVAIILLVLLLLSILPAYYVLYYRYKIYYRFLVDKLGAINDVLLDDIPEEDKLARIRSLWYDGNRYLSDTERTAALTSVVDQICNALEDSIAMRRRSMDKLELANDELHRLRFENDRLHVNNNILDNCFSTLKHETMYYPSRIRQLITGAERNLPALHEITTFYKELYSLLSMQAQNQVETNLKINGYIISYLLSLLKKVSGAKQLHLISREIDATYVQYTIEMPGLRLSDEEVNNLFTPLTSRIPCLVIRQIVREIGETTNHRGCGVMASKREDGGTDVVITLSRKVKMTE